jgi:putative ATP-binding cassette transporter
MKLLKIFLAAAPRTLVLAVILGALAGAAGMALIAQVNATLRSGNVAAAFVWLFAALCLLRIVLGLFGQMQLHELGQQSVQDLRMRLSYAILGAPQRKLEELGAPTLLGVLTEDVAALAEGGRALAQFLAQMAFVVACCLYLLYLSPLAFVFVGIAFAAGYVVQRKIDKKADDWFTPARKDRAAMMAGFRALTEGAKELKLHASKGESVIAEAIDAPAAEYGRKHAWGGGVLVVVRYWFSFVFFILVGLLLFVWPEVRPTDTPILVSYVLTVLYMQSTIESVMQLLPSLSYAANAMKGVTSLGLTIPEKAAALEEPAPMTCDSIELRGVVHAYKGEGGEGTFSLGPVDLTLRRGEVVFFVGGNGSGKSTLVKVLTGLYAPEAGEVHVDGRPVTEADQASYRQMFSAVFADWHLFDRLFGMKGAAIDDDARRYLEELQLSKKVEVKDGAFSTTALSQGQRKRLMLLTAYLEDRPVYVFDEWASDQDPIFKETFYKDILQRLRARGKMVIVVSHDDRYFHAADRVVWLEEGKVTSTSAPQQQAS